MKFYTVIANMILWLVLAVIPGIIFNIRRVHLVVCNPVKRSLPLQVWLDVVDEHRLGSCMTVLLHDVLENSQEVLILAKKEPHLTHCLCHYGVIRIIFTVLTAYVFMV